MEDEDDDVGVSLNLDNPRARASMEDLHARR